MRDKLIENIASVTGLLTVFKPLLTLKRCWVISTHHWLKNGHTQPDVTFPTGKLENSFDNQIPEMDRF